jgi:oligopeptide/dipeptide ABC transporter ATP-binding protein
MDHSIMKLLNILDLTVSLPTETGNLLASNLVSLQIGKGEKYCLIGESGCGKTIIALAIMRLLPVNATIKGTILFNGMNLLSLSEKSMRKIRGQKIAMIFEQPQSCLNPLFRVGDQIAEAVKIRDNCSGKAARKKALELMTKVRMPDPEKTFRMFPHEYSGGMAQRAIIAIAMAIRPSLLIADEPTTSLDVNVKAQILALLENFVNEFNASLFLITHDLKTAFLMCEKISIMYAGYIIEEGSIANIKKNPRHPYTQALISTISDESPLHLQGTVPELTKLPKGCPFHPRCYACFEICKKEMPQMEKGVRCHLRQHA